jgi:hypothetical protein
VWRARAMNKARGRPFEPGNKLGRGRPRGSRNKAKSPGQDLLDEYAPHLTRKCIAQAMQGEPSAMRICMARISPARPDAVIQMNLPAIRKAEDLDKAAEKVTQGLRRGKITPVEAGRVMNILEGRLKILETVELAERIKKVEEKIAAAEGLPRAA